MSNTPPSQVNLTFPVGMIWKIAFGTSAIIGILQVIGVADVPWWTFLIPIAVPIALAITVVIGLAVAGIIVVVIGVIAVGIDNLVLKHKMRKRDKMRKLKVVKK